MLKNSLRCRGSALVVPLALFASACGSTDDNTVPAGTGGAAGSGGSTSTSASTTSGGGDTTAGGGGGAGGAGGTAGGTAGTGGTAAAGGTDGGGDAGVCLSGPLERPTVPAAIEAPATATVVVRYHAEGKQIYTCTATTSDAGADAGTIYAWTLKAPDATLYDASCVKKGTHFAGPTWQSIDGSSVVGARLASAPSATANSVPLLLLKATSTMGEGIFSNVTFVHRLDTIGGNAPADGCNAGTVSTEAAINYSANYYYYAGGATEGGVAVTSAGPGE